MKQRETEYPTYSISYITALADWRKWQNHRRYISTPSISCKSYQSLCDFDPILEFDSTSGYQIFWRCNNCGDLAVSLTRHGTGYMYHLTVGKLECNRAYNEYQFLLSKDHFRRRDNA